MIKLKSLFRRGHNSSSSGSSSKHSSNNNRQKSQSTTSLNSQGKTEALSEQQQQPVAGVNTTSPAKFYTNEAISERGVDVGDEQQQQQYIANHKQQQQQQQQTNTLNSKKIKTKGHKQPKQLPIPQVTQQVPNAAYDSTQPQQQQQQHYNSNNNAANQQKQQQPQNSTPANVMTSIALAPGSQNSTVTNTAQQQGGGGGAGLGGNSVGGIGVVGNNNYALPPIHDMQQHAATANELYKLNTAIAAAAVASNYHQQFLNTEQQQQQLLEANSKMQELQTKLDCLGKEKQLLESRITELTPYQNQVAKLKTELSKMQAQCEKNQLEISNLKYENESLRNRLRDVVNSPLSDAEKHQIIQDSQRLHSSAPASIALPNATDSDVLCGQANFNSSGMGSIGGVGGTTTPCLTPDWDKQSSSSEISVACLQDKIIQMEETHYSTNEELQATLQELADLQAQLTDAQAENERLTEEKDVLFQSLCRQTEKLSDTRTQISTLQELLLRDAKQAEIGTSERENKLLALLKTSQEERETILVKQEELNSEMQELRLTLDNANQDNKRCRERIALLDSTVDASNAERKQIELQLQQAKDEVSQRDIEINRLTTLLENARSKIEELEQDLARGEKTDLTDLLDAARKEKDSLEERVAELQDQCSRSQAEIRRLREQLATLTEESKVATNNAKCAVSNLEYQLEQLQQEKDKLSADYQQVLESNAELQVQCKCHQEDKQQLQNLLTETQTHLGEVERKLNKTEEKLEKERELRTQEAEEWQQFQSDLLLTVRVANDFKTEALSEREQLVIDNKTQKEKIRMLEQQIEKLTKQQLQQTETSVLSTVQQEMASRRNKVGSFSRQDSLTQQTETQQSVLTSVQQEMATRRNKVGSFSRQDSRLSVKSLIETIEGTKQQQAKSEAEASTESRYSSSSSLNSATQEITATSPVINNSNTPNELNQNVRLSTTAITTTTPTTNSTNTAVNTKGPLREQQQQKQPQPASPGLSSLHISSLHNLNKSPLSGERKDPLNMLVKNGGSKRNALLKWCQNKTVGYRNIDITNFSSSWNDGLAFCAILHSYLPDSIPYDTLTPANKRRNFSLAFQAAESVGIPTTLNINDMCQLERPDWTQVMSYITAIYKHFET